MSSRCCARAHVHTRARITKCGGSRPFFLMWRCCKGGKEEIRKTWQQAMDEGAGRGRRAGSTSQGLAHSQPAGLTSPHKQSHAARARAISYAYTQAKQACKCTRAHKRTYIQVHVCTHTYTCLHTHTSTCKNTHTRTQTHTHIYTHTRTHMHARTHTHTRTGEGGVAAPRLRDADLTPQRLRQAYTEMVVIIRTLYQTCRLVHADLSEYNILYHKVLLPVLPLAGLLLAGLLLAGGWRACVLGGRAQSAGGAGRVRQLLGEVQPVARGWWLCQPAPSGSGPHSSRPLPALRVTIVMVDYGP